MRAACRKLHFPQNGLSGIQEVIKFVDVSRPVHSPQKRATILQQALKKNSIGARRPPHISLGGEKTAFTRSRNRPNPDNAGPILVCSEVNF